MTRQRHVAIFDADLPTGLAFIRSLGRIGVPFTAYSHDPRAMGRYSRYVSDFQICPDVKRTDEFVSWLLRQTEHGAIDLVAPTSDYVAFNVAAAIDSVGALTHLGGPSHHNLLDCLFKDRFAAAMAAFGFPTPATLAPKSIDEAHRAAESIGYPVVAKPRSHVAVGVARGEVLRSPGDLDRLLVPYSVDRDQVLALEQDQDLRWPVIQKFLDRSGVEVISVTGCLDRRGRAMAIGHSRKTHQWPPGLGIGTRFEALGRQPFTDHAINAVSSVLGSGIFELEVLFDRRTLEYWAIDLNPRAFGQISLDIASGHDLPALWYGSETNAEVDIRYGPERKPPDTWTMGMPFAADLMVRSLRGPQRRSAVAAAVRAIKQRSVGAAFDRGDALPALAFGRSFLRHPGGLIRPFLQRSSV